MTTEEEEMQQYYVQGEDESTISNILGTVFPSREEGAVGQDPSQPPKKIQKLDEVVEDKGVRVIVDSAALLFIVGMEMDYVDTEIKSEFVFNNPNAKGTCGCGESFHV